MRGAAIFALTLMVSPELAVAHSGGLNADGCHTNRRTGEYHCHRPQRTTPRAQAPAWGGGAFRNCSEARAAGAAPIRRGQPGYGAHLDRDNDGIACE
jgi:hypothetical protein